MKHVVDITIKPGTKPITGKVIYTHDKQTVIEVVRKIYGTKAIVNVSDNNHSR